MIKSIVRNLVNSFHNGPEGFSARKLSAWVAVMVATYATIQYTSMVNEVEVLIVWLCFGLLCLGIVTMEQVIKLKNGGKHDSTV